MADLNYIQRMKDIRERNILLRAGKALIFSEDQMVDLIAAKKVPTQMQHCIIKVMQKMPGNDKERFISAFNICGAVFQNHGYQQPGTTTLTPKGLQNNLRHRREVDGGTKSSNYRSIEQRLWAPSVDRSVKSKTQKAQTEYEQWKAQKDQKNKTAQDRVNNEKE